MELTKWESASNYMGPDYSDYYVIFGHHRDSDMLQESNYDTILELLKPYDIEVISFGSWLVGWTEDIMIHEDNLTTEARNTIQSIYEDLEGYPVLDESDYSSREYDYALTVIDDMCTAQYLDLDNLPDDWKEQVFSSMWDNDCYIQEDSWPEEQTFIDALKQLNFYDWEGNDETPPVKKEWEKAIEHPNQTDLRRFP